MVESAVGMLVDRVGWTVMVTIVLWMEEVGFVVSVTGLGFS
jgi:hypothetical protein